MQNDSMMTRFIDRLKFSDFRSSVTFDMGDDGIVSIDAGQNPPVLTEGEADTQLRVTASKDLLKGFLDGTKDPNMAFMMGKLKISGSMGLAMKLNAVFED